MQLPGGHRQRAWLRSVRGAFVLGSRVGSTTWLTFAVRDWADMGVPARFAAAALTSVEANADALAVHSLAGPTLLKFQRRLLRWRALRFRLRLDFGLWGSLWWRWQTLPATVIPLLRLKCLGSRGQGGVEDLATIGHLRQRVIE